MKQLIGARAWILTTKIQVLEELVDKVAKEDPASKVELREARVARDAFAGAYAGEYEHITGDAKIFKE